MTKPWLVPSLVVGLALMLATPVLADFQAGKDAFARGDYETAVKESRLLAEQGHAMAKYILGFMCAQGKGVPQDEVLALM